MKTFRKGLLMEMDKSGVGGKIGIDGRPQGGVTGPLLFSSIVRGDGEVRKYLLHTERERSRRRGTNNERTVSKFTSCSRSRKRADDGQIRCSIRGPEEDNGP